VRFTGGSDATDEVKATGNVSGKPPSGGEESGATDILPPDIAGMNYEQNADYKISASDPQMIPMSGNRGKYSDSNPKHIFQLNYRDDLGPSGYQTDNPNWFLFDQSAGSMTDRFEPGSPTYGRSCGRITVSSSGNNKTYYVDGNLWLEPWDYSMVLKTQGSDGTHITIVAKGNIYVCDALYMENAAKDGITLIAIKDGESFEDADGDNQYDQGERILNDDGDGVYEGSREGSGNIYFGDPNTGPVGTVQAFMYAENDFEDHVLDQNGRPLDFKIKGVMTAGNHVSIGRDFGGQHAQMLIEYDNRIETGSLELPDLPRGSDPDKGTWFVVSWRNLLP